MARIGWKERCEGEKGREGREGGGARTGSKKWREEERRVPSGFDSDSVVLLYARFLPCRRSFLSLSVCPVRHGTDIIISDVHTPVGSTPVNDSFLDVTHILGHV